MPLLPRYITNDPIVDANGRPTVWFQDYINGNFDTLRINAAAAASAQSAADTALAEATDAATDGIITPHEKFTEVIPAYNYFHDTNTDFVAKATNYGTPVSTQLTAYNTAYSAWTSYLATLTSPVMWNDTSGQTNIVRSTWDTKWGDLKAKRDALDNAMTAQAGVQATWSSVTGPNRPADNATANIVYYSSTAPTTPNNGDIWVDTSVNPNVTKVRVAGAWQVSANLTTNTNQLTDGAGLGTTATWTGVTGTGTPETNADITRWVDAPPQSTVFQYDYAGNPQSGEFPRTLTFKLMAPSGQITSGITWSYTVQVGTVNGFTSASGSQAMSGAGTGSTSITSLGTSAATILVSAAYGGKTFVRTVDLSRNVAAPPIGTGVIASMSSGFSGPSTTTYVDVTGGGIPGTMPSGKTTANINVSLSAMPSSGTSGSWTVSCRVTRIISGTDTQIGSAQTAGSAWFASDFSGNDAQFNFTISDTGLTSGSTYSWFVEMSVSAGGSRGHNVTGQVTVST